MKLGKLGGRILITGGAGFLGRAILRRIEREGWNADVTIYSRDEHKQDEIRKRWPDVRRVLGDVQNFDRLLGTLRAGAPYDLVIHAAALKFIPEAEHNVTECVDVNVNGSRNVIMAAHAAGVGTVVGLSTDKAAAPLNTYGMTKGVMERLFGEANDTSRTRYTCVRYGNVVSSSGSVIPAFREQYKATGRVRVTDPRMTRFWLTMDDAINMIITAAGCAHQYPGAVFVPRCGAMKIIDLARVAVGDRNAEIEIVGIRPGEKLHETLALETEMVRAEALGMLEDADGHTSATGFDVLAIRRPIEAPVDDAIYFKEYRSDDPDWWIGADDMASWIDDAQSII